MFENDSKIKVKSLLKPYYEQSIGQHVLRTTYTHTYTKRVQMTVTVFTIS